MNLYQPTITGSLSVSGSVNISGSITIAGGGTISGTASIATTALTASFVANAQTASYVLNAVSSSFALTASSADNFLVRNTLTAQTLVVQTITSSVDFVTGSTRFGSSLSTSTHQFTGSVNITGSTNLAGALSGTSATFSSLVTISSDSGGSALRLIGRAAGDSSAIRFFANNNSTQNARIESNSSEFEINSISSLPITFKTADTTRLTIASTGAATFSSSVTATQSLILNGTNPNFDLQNSGTSRFRLELDGSNFTYLSTIGANDMILRTNATARLTLNGSTGAATFSSSVTADSLNINTSTVFVRANIADTLTATSIGSNYNPGILNIQNKSATNGNLSLIGFQDANQFINLAAMGSINETHAGSPNGVTGALAFYTKASGTGFISERMRITSGGNVFINNPSGVSLNGLTNFLSVSSTTYNLFDISRFSDNAFGPNFYLVKSRNGTIGGNTIVASGDNLGNITWLGANGTGFTDAASIRAEVDGSPGASNDMPGRLVFSTTADGAGSVTERMRITSEGKILIGTTSSANTGLGTKTKQYIVGDGSTNAAASHGSMFVAAGTGTADTGISVNQGTSGMTMILIASINTSTGTSTNSAVYIVRFYFSGNTTPTATYIGGSSDFVTFSTSGNNTLNLTGSSSGNKSYAWFVNKFGDV
jgi:hypothetical protein